MIIKKIEIKSFGKFCDYSLVLDSDIQIIYGPNESGKSTLMEFLKIMFYSRRKGNLTSNEDKDLRKKYLSWDTKLMQGSIEFIHEGYDFKLQKELHESSVSKDIIFLRNNSLGEKVKLGKRQEIGEYLFNLDLLSFERSSYMGDISKTGFENLKSSENTLLNKIINLADIGEEDTKVTIISSRINNAIKDLESPKSKKGKILKLQTEIENLKEEIQQLKEFEKEQTEIISKASKLNSLIEEKNKLKNEVTHIENLKKIYDLENIVKKIKANNKIILELERLNVSEKTIENLCLLKKEIDSNLARIEELKSIINSLKMDFLEISDKEIENLNSKLKEKECLKDKINNLKILLSLNSIQSINSYFNDDVNFSSFYNDWNLKKKELIKLENLKEALNFNATDSKDKLINLNTSLDYKYKINKKMSLLYFLIFCTIVVSNFTKLNLLLRIVLNFIFLCGSIFCFLFFKNNNKQIKYLKTNIDEINLNTSKLETLETELNKAKISIQNLELEIKKLSENKIYMLEKSLESIEENINNLLQDKNCHLVSEYYENYAKSQNFLQTKLFYNQLITKIEDLKLEFINTTRMDSYSEAINFLENIISKKESIKLNEKEIQNSLHLLNLENLTLTELENKLKDIKLNSKVDAKENYKSIKKRLEELEELNLEKNYFETKSKIKYSNKNLSSLEKALNLKSKQLLDMQEYLKSLKIANTLLEESSSEIRKEFNPQLDLEASKIFKKLTGGKYENIYISRDYKIITQQNMRQINGESLSAGTIDQAYFALKIAVSKLISHGKVPLILDDTLIRYDENRMKSALDFLKENSKSTQTIIFTCHEYIVKHAEEKGIKIIKL